MVQIPRKPAEGSRAARTRTFRYATCARGISTWVASRRRLGTSYVIYADIAAAPAEIALSYPSVNLRADFSTPRVSSRPDERAGSIVSCELRAPCGKLSPRRGTNENFSIEFLVRGDATWRVSLRLFFPLFSSLLFSSRFFPRAPTSRYGLFIFVLSAADSSDRNESTAPKETSTIRDPVSRSPRGSRRERIGAD